jgi:hypothetical protein
MSSNMEKVIIAADLIDRFGRNKDWRAKVDLETLDMISANYCILGQTQGVYNAVLNKLRDGDSFAYGKCYDAFASFDEEWKEYIRAFQPGAEWISDSGAWYTATSYFMYDGVPHLTVTRGTGIFISKPVASMRQWKLKPKYTAGRLYRSADKKLVFLYRDGNTAYGNNTLRLIGSDSYSSGTNVGDMDYYERVHGPLTEVTWMGSTISAQIDS